MRQEPEPAPIIPRSMEPRTFLTLAPETVITLVEHMGSIGMVATLTLHGEYIRLSKEQAVRLGIALVNWGEAT